MARHRKIDLRMHGDEKYRQLTPCPPCGQALWWHLLAGKQTGMVPGLYSIGEAAFAEQLRWPILGFRKAFAEVLSLGMATVDWDAPLIWIPKAIVYNQPESPNVVTSWRLPWDELPECSLKAVAHDSIKAFLEGISEAFGEAFRKSCPKPSSVPSPKSSPNQEQEQEQDTPLPPKGGVMDGFEDFWKAYPRKVAKPAAARAWRAAHPDGEAADRIIADVRRRAAGPDWTKDEGKFVPHPATYLNQRRWEDEPTVSNGVPDHELARRYAGDRGDDGL